MTVDRFLFSLCLVSILVLVQILEVLKSIYAQLLSALSIMKCLVTLFIAAYYPIAILLALTSFSRASASKWLNYDSDLDSLVWEFCCFSLCDSIVNNTINQFISAGVLNPIFRAWIGLLDSNHNIHRCKKEDFHFPSIIQHWNQKLMGPFFFSFFFKKKKKHFSTHLFEPPEKLISLTKLHYLRCTIFCHLYLLPLHL